MQQFINQIVIFLNQVYQAISNAIYTQLGQVISTQYDNFLTKNVFSDSSWIGVNITWLELFRFISIWVLAILFIVLFVKFIIKILGIFRTRFND